MRVLLVVDMLNDFIEEEGVLQCGEEGRKTVPFVVELVKRFFGEGGAVIFAADEHEEEDSEFAVFPPHCIRGSWGAQLVAPLQELYQRGLEEGQPVYRLPKQRYSAFYNTRLEELLAELGATEVHVVGVCTNICVYATVEELWNRQIPTKVYQQGVASFDPEGHRVALRQMKELFNAEIVSFSLI